MPRAEAELRATKRELLLVRAAAERAELASHLNSIATRTRTGLPGLLLHGERSTQRTRGLRLAASVLKLLRSRPWLLPTILGAAPRLVRARTLGWIALVGLVVGAWWINRQTKSADEAEAETESDEPSPFLND